MPTPLSSLLLRAGDPRARIRGSALIVTLLMCAIIGISLASYLQLGRTSLTVSNRALFNNAAMNLAENGLEEAMYSINQRIADEDYDWEADGWKISGANAYRKWTPDSDRFLRFDQNARGEIRVYVANYAGISSAPTIVARSTITLGGAASAPLEKWVEVSLTKTSKFSNGLVAKNSIVFNGTTTKVDSWNSDPDNDGDPADVVPYSAAVRNDNGSVGSISVSVDAVLVKNADIWGYAATGGSSVVVGSTGSVLGDDSAAKDKTGWADPDVDPDRVSTDFSANFDPVSPPSIGGESLGSVGTKALPEAGDVAVDGIYYYTATSIGGSNKVLTIKGNSKVVITVTGSISIGGGSGSIQINTGSELALYVNGDVDIKGQGAANGTPSSVAAGPTLFEAQQPAKFQIYGTNITSQTIDITGNGALSAVVYAPSANVFIRGGGEALGSIVANNITIVGNASFHYDESLGNFGGSNPYRVSRWNELTTAASRATYATALNF